MTKIVSKKFSTSALALAAVQAAVLAPIAPSIALASEANDTLTLVTAGFDGALLPADAEPNGAQMAVTGKVFLASADAEVSEFMLVSDTGFCPWCGSSDHGMAVEVELDSPLALEHGAQITVEGALEALNAGNGHTATRMLDAVVL